MEYLSKNLSKRLMAGLLLIFEFATHILLLIKYKSKKLFISQILCKNIINLLRDVFLSYYKNQL